ncbi:MAG: HAD family hydrolase [Alphaproteobacteria bacterium]
MTLQRPTIVIFDMDGTAVRHINPHLLHVLEVLDNVCYKISKVFAWLFKRGGQGPIVPEWHDPEWSNQKKKKPKLLVHRAIHKVRRKPVEQIVQPCPGLYDVLDFLKENNVPMALVSNGLGKGYGDDIVKKFDLDEYFQTTVFREDISHSKPHPEPILLALKRMNLKPTEDDIIWYLGDRRKDVIAALSASDLIDGVTLPIAVAFNAAVAVLEKGLGSDHIIMSFHDMYDQLKEIFEKQPAATEKKTLTEPENTVESTEADLPSTQHI